MAASSSSGSGRSSSNRRVTLILAIGGVLIALLAAYNLFGGGGDDGGSGSSVAPATSRTADSGQPSDTQTTTPTTTPGAPELPSGESFDVFATRNPFEPAIQVTPASTDVPEGTSNPGSSPPPGATPVEPTTPSPEPAAGTTVALVEVFDQSGTPTAVVQVGSEQFTVAAGQVFATSYKVVSISGTCGQFLYGDSPFSLCQGQQVIK